MFTVPMVVRWPRSRHRCTSAADLGSSIRKLATGPDGIRQGSAKPEVHGTRPVVAYGYTDSTLSTPDTTRTAVVDLVSGLERSWVSGNPPVSYAAAWGAGDEPRWQVGFVRGSQYDPSRDQPMGLAHADGSPRGDEVAFFEQEGPTLATHGFRIHGLIGPWIFVAASVPYISTLPSLLLAHDSMSLMAPPVGRRCPKHPHSRDVESGIRGRSGAQLRGIAQVAGTSCAVVDCNRLQSRAVVGWCTLGAPSVIKAPPPHRRQREPAG